ncbi:MAG: ABC transporter ATP-binding protein [Candidatus Margulisiibacteriota bacterium]
MPSVTALQEMTLEIKTGEFVSIVGHSGSGKSTLLYILGLLDEATSGEYWLDDLKTSQLSANQKATFRSRKIGFIFQSFHLVSRYSVSRNVALPRRYSDISTSFDMKDYLSQFGIADKINVLPSQLSGGQQQRVAIARALINNPEIILADEPTGNLDSQTSLEIMNILCDLHKKGKTILLVTHNTELTHFSQRLIKIKDGRLDDDRRL